MSVVASAIFCVFYCFTIRASDTNSKKVLIWKTGWKLLTNTKRTQSVTLTFSNNILFNVSCLTYKGQNGQTPVCLSGLLKSYVPLDVIIICCWSLWGPDLSKEVIRPFAAAAPKLWNKLPLHIKKAPNFLLFLIIYFMGLTLFYFILPLVILYVVTLNTFEYLKHFGWQQ